MNQINANFNGYLIKLAKYGYASALRRLLMLIFMWVPMRRMQMEAEFIVIFLGLFCISGLEDAQHNKTRIGCFFKTYSVLLGMLFVLFANQFLSFEAKVLIQLQIIGLVVVFSCESIQVEILQFLGIFIAVLLIAYWQGTDSTLLLLLLSSVMRIEQEKAFCSGQKVGLLFKL